MFNEHSFNTVMYSDNGNTPSYAFPPTTSNAWLPVQLTGAPNFADVYNNSGDYNSDEIYNSYILPVSEWEPKDWVDNP